jgi:2,4-dienoyl-CoA reductase-like NADH-dependent reductase (Old Yellow Enzyme family)
VKKESTRIREGLFDDFARRVQEIETDVAVQLSGGFRSRIGMADAVESKTCDLIGVRPFPSSVHVPYSIRLHSWEEPSFWILTFVGTSFSILMC